MATSVATLTQRVRRQLRDWRDQDTLTLSVTSGATTITIADSTLYFVNETIEVDSEAMIVRALPTATTLTVTRGAFGTTAATHANAADVLLNPRFMAVEIVDAIADGIDAAFPYVYFRNLDTSLTATDNTYEYTIPNGNNSLPIPFIHKVETKESGESTYWQVRNWLIVRDDKTGVPKIKFRISQPASATIRVHGYDYFPRLTASASLDAAWPTSLEYPLVMYACSLLLASGEFGRVSVDRGVIDEREQANRPGVSMSASQYGLQWYLQRVRSCGFAPMSKHVRPVT